MDPINGPGEPNVPVHATRSCSGACNHHEASLLYGKQTHQLCYFAHCTNQMAIVATTNIHWLICAVLDYNATFINDFGVALLNVLAGSAKPDAGSGGTFVSPVSVMLALALLLNGAAPGSSTFWCALVGGRRWSNANAAPM